MAVNQELLLFIEPENEPSEKPVIDELTKKMTAYFRKAKTGAIHCYSKMGQGYEFKEDDGWLGWHNCSCGANAGGQDYLLPNGEMTNANCIHYLAYHRDEISQEQLDRVANLGDDNRQPNEDEIERDRQEWQKNLEIGKKKPMSREEYIDFLSERNFD